MKKLIARIFAGVMIGATFAFACLSSVWLTFAFGEHLAWLTRDESALHISIAFVEIFGIIGGAVAAFVSYILWKDKRETENAYGGKKSWTELFVLWFRG